MRSSRGFTLLELFVALGIAAVLAALGGFAIDRTVKQARTDRAARNLELDLRMAQAIAARTNRAVRFTFRRAAADGCPGSSYVIDGTESTVVGVNPFDVRYRMVCIPNVYPQVVVNAETAPADFGNLICTNDSGMDPPTPLPGDGCSFCGGGDGTLTFFPSGEITPAPVVTATGIEALSFSWRDDPAVAPAGLATRVRAVTLDTLGGRTRVLRPVPAAAGADPSVWGCR